MARPVNPPWLALRLADVAVMATLTERGALPIPTEARTVVEGSRRRADQLAAWQMLRRKASMEARVCKPPPVTRLGKMNTTLIRGIERSPGHRRVVPRRILRLLHRLGGSPLPAVLRRFTRAVRRRQHLAMRMVGMRFQCVAGGMAARPVQRPARGETAEGKAMIAEDPPASRPEYCCLARLYSTVFAQTLARLGDPRSRLLATTMIMAGTTGLPTRRCLR